MKTIFTAALLFVLFSVNAQQVVRLYPGAAPGSEGWQHAERTDSILGKNVVLVSGVSVPTLTVYRPASQSGAAMIVCPGGAFWSLAVQHEGEAVAKWLNTKGITAFVLKYRTVPGKSVLDPDLGADLAARRYDRIDEVNRPHIPLAVQDGQTAVRYLRAHATEFGINPDRIGMMGFSAGGSLTLLTTLSEGEGSRPDFIAPIYAYVPAEWAAKIPGGLPPLFLALSADDPIAEGNLGLFEKWRAAGNPAELHVFAQGGHGYGMNPQNLPSDDWKVQLAEWMEIQGLFITKTRLANDNPAGARWWRESNEERGRSDFAWLKRFEMDNQKLPPAKSGSCSWAIRSPRAGLVPIPVFSRENPT